MYAMPPTRHLSVHATATKNENFLPFSCTFIFKSSRNSIKKVLKDCGNLFVISNTSILRTFATTTKMFLYIEVQFIINLQNPEFPGPNSASVPSFMLLWHQKLKNRQTKLPKTNEDINLIHLLSHVDIHSLYRGTFYNCPSGLCLLCYTKEFVKSSFRSIYFPVFWPG